MIAGHETTSFATAWTLFALAQAPQVQRKLRDELLDVKTDAPSMDELNALPYLDAVIREALRLYSPVCVTVREARKDDVIPLNNPYTDRHGLVHDHITHVPPLHIHGTVLMAVTRIQRGTAILIPILAMNRSKIFWGEDAAEFK